jgi:hypothetical protein
MDSRLQSLWQAAQYQESLLQGYRRIHIGIQIAFLSIAILLVLVLLNCKLAHPALVYALLTVLNLVAVVLFFKTRGVVKSRYNDVDYFQQQIMEAEKQLGANEQVLTIFKQFQKPNTSELTEGEKGYTRKVLDTYIFYWFIPIWLILHAVAVIRILS